MLPFILPGAVINWVADVVIINCDAIKRRQLILPPRVAVGICVALGWRQSANTGGRISISLLRQNVPALVVGENPSRACTARCGVRLVIDPRQLADVVILVLRGQAAGGAVRAGQGGFLMVGMGSPAFLACCEFI